MIETATTLRDGRYAIVGTLGRGGQGVTLEATDAARGGKHVAIKRFDVQGASSWKDVELAEREARVLASLDHPALPRYVEHFEEGGALYLVTEMIDGESLASVVKRAAMREDDVWRFLREAGAALAYLHERAVPIVHRDIKPTNVIVRADGSFALIDFGAVRDRLKPEGGSTVVGTFGFMAPEQFQGRALPASDVYATAATALVALTGEQPEDLPHRGLRLDARSALGGRVSERLVAALEAMLEPDPDVRASRIGPLLAGASTPASSEPAPIESRAQRRHARRARRAARSRDPFAPLMAALWTAWGLSWWLLRPTWLTMMLAMIPILLLGSWVRSRRRARATLPTPETRARIAGEAPADARVRVEVAEHDQPSDEDESSERQTGRDSNMRSSTKQ